MPGQMDRRSRKIGLHQFFRVKIQPTKFCFFSLVQTLSFRQMKLSYVWLSFQELPPTQLPEVFGMHDNVDITRELHETQQLFDSVLLTLGQGDGGMSGQTDETLFEIATDILAKVCLFTFFLFLLHHFLFAKRSDYYTRNYSYKFLHCWNIYHNFSVN